jgi:hypothetical protein
MPQKLTDGPLIANKPIMYKDIPLLPKDRQALDNRFTREQSALSRHAQYWDSRGRIWGRDAQGVLNLIPFVDPSVGRNVNKWMVKQAESYTNPIKERELLIQQSRTRLKKTNDWQNNGDAWLLDHFRKSNQ